MNIPTVCTVFTSGLQSSACAIKGNRNSEFGNNTESNWKRWPGSKGEAGQKGFPVLQVRISGSHPGQVDRGCGVVMKEKL